MPAPFVHLHCHTDYSLLDGACEIKRMMEVVKQQDMPAVAMTDHGNLFGAVEFFAAANDAGVHPVLGCEVYVAQDRKSRNESDRYNHFLLLCENQDGYRNLIDLVSTAYLEGFYYKPRIDKSLLAGRTKGLIALSACLRGDVNEALLADQEDTAARLANEYREMFGEGNFFLEIQDHGLEQDRKILPALYRLSRQTGIPLVATNDSHYLTKNDARAHEILLCIQTGKTMSDTNRMRFSTQEFHLKSREEMMLLFGEVEDALDRTWDIAQRCKVKLSKVTEPFPRFDVPAEHNTDSYFAYVAQQGLEKRMGRLEKMAANGQLRCPLPTYRERVEHEIRIIQQMQFSGYFLIVWDFIRYAKEHQIPVGPGRGSAAGSLVSYAMEITDIDPLQYGLLFERFLNPERISMPDIDIDFCTHGRGQVIQYVTEKYGREQVAQIITFGTLGAKASIKDVGRVLDLSFGDVDRITKLVPPVLDIKLKMAFEMEPGFDDLKKKDPRVAEVLDTAVKLEGMARNASIHAAGVVIAPEPLKNLVPLYKTSKDEIVTQYDGIGLEKLGLLKMDFLGLTALTIIADALKMIERLHDRHIVLDELPLDDPKTYELFGKAYTGGVFQFESSGMKDILRRSQPGRLEDLCALNALYRPGPIKGGMIDDYIDRKLGRKEFTYDFPELQDILDETYGVIVYQEQVMQISNRLAGYSLGDADLLRRAMGKKKKEEMEKQRERFVSGALERNHPQKKVVKIFDLMEQFAGYGFNKSHSAAYAYLAYLTGYLKANYPLEFMSALLTSETGNASKVVKYIHECREMGIKVLPPDVNISGKHFTPDGEGIRFGLTAIKNVGESAMESLLAARAKDGRFSSIFDLCERVDSSSLNKRMLESLIKAGAMDALGGTRSQLMAVLDSAMEEAQRAQRDRYSGQSGLFGFIAEEHAKPTLPNLPDWTGPQKLQGEKEMLGFYITGHPLDQYRDKVSEVATHSSATLEGLQKGVEVKVCGVITNVQRRRNKDGKAWASMQLEDWEGSIEALVFAGQYESVQQFLGEDTAVLIKALALPEEGTNCKISVQDVIPLEKVGVNLPSLVQVRIPLGRSPKTAESVAALQVLIARKPGQAGIRLQLEAPRDFLLTIDLDTRVRPDREFKAEVQRICGAEAYEELAK